jgi:hypothetical protein
MNDAQALARRQPRLFGRCVARVAFARITTNARIETGIDL